MKTVNTQCGIYKTKYSLICHRNGEFSVKAPYISWRGNTGSLAFRTVKINKFKDSIREAFNGKSNITVSEIVHANQNQ